MEYFTPPLFILKLLVLNLANIFVLQVLIKPVLDLAHSSAKQWLHLRNLGPLGPDFVMHHENEGILLRGPLPSDDARVYDVMPSLAALSAEAAWEETGDNDPVLGAVLLHLLTQNPVLLLGPLGARTDVLGGRQGQLAVFLLLLLQEEPSLEATDLSLVRHELAQAVP